ncbi:MAG: hypothetical protein ABIJ50_02725 [Pseudomonadota bacterium]
MHGSILFSFEAIKESLSFIRPHARHESRVEQEADLPIMAGTFIDASSHATTTCPPAMVAHQPPLIKPCLRFSRARLSDVLHRKACALVQPAVVGTLYRPYFSYSDLLGNLT